MPERVTFENGCGYGGGDAIYEACRIMRCWLLNAGGYAEAIEEQIDPLLRKGGVNFNVTED